MPTVLKYPKKMFNKCEVIREKDKMRYPEFWIYSSTKTDHQLTFKPPEIRNKPIRASAFGVPDRL